MERFVEVFCQAAQSVLSQCSGREWKLQISDGQDEGGDNRIVVAASGGLAGELALELPAGTAQALAEALLTQRASDESEQRDALVEVINQIFGAAATALRPRFSEVSFAVSLAAPPWQPQKKLHIRIERPEWSGSAAMLLSAELIAAIQAHAIETDRPALTKARAGRNLDLLLDVRVGVRLRFGSRRMKLREILELQPGSVVELDRLVQEPVDLLVDSKLIGRGEVVVTDGRYGLRVGEVVTAQERVQSLE
jgi:flagellar motor switch protein FliN/FliY